MITAVTGTRFGATPDQIVALEQWITREMVSVLHHGDCVGADDQAARVARRLGCRIICHPPVQAGDRANFPSDETRDMLTYLARNRQMVEEAKRLIALPKGFQEEERGGTWYTIRYARKRGYPVTIIWPDGRVESEATWTQADLDAASEAAKKMKARCFRYGVNIEGST